MSRNLISAMMANADAEEQADILNGFVLHLGAMCKTNPYGSLDNQQYFITHNLRGETIAFFRGIIESWDYINKESDKSQAKLRQIQKSIDDAEKRLAENRRLLDQEEN